VVAEALTSVLIGINRRYGIEGAGIRITGEPAAAQPPAPQPGMGQPPAPQPGMGQAKAGS
jgi:hypothetical protein